MNQWGELKRDSQFQQWIEEKGWTQYPELTIGQRVKAVQEIYWNETSNRCIKFGTLGRVVSKVERGNQIYNIKWDGKKSTWACVYSPVARFEEDGYSIDTEIAIVEEVDATQDPRTYMTPLLTADENEVSSW